MSTEETELTFVRCPGCRSLVPAVASRCRMCGENLEKQETPAKSTTSSSVSGRVRQRTMSLAEHEVQQLRNEEQKAEPEATDETIRETTNETTNERTIIAESPRPKKKRRRRKKKKLHTEEGLSINNHVGNVAPASFRLDNERERKVEVAPVVKEEAQEKVQKEEVGFQKVIKEDKQVMRHERGRKEDSTPVAPLSNPEIADKGGLIGWFVHFGPDKTCQAIEIQSGRYFIGREKIKDSDLIIDHESVSSPHCLISAGIHGQIKVQDLMSEDGTYVRGSDEENFYKYAEPVSLRHGDWLRLGEYEVLVCLISLKR
jgi:hypothetical protein